MKGGLDKRIAKCVKIKTLFNIKFMRKLCVSLMALVAVFFVSCSTETDIIEENDGGKDVTLTISTSPLTKSAYTESYSSKKAEIKNLLVYFLDNNDDVITYFDLQGEAPTGLPGSGTGSLGAGTGSLDAGYSYKFTNLESSINKVYVVANLNADQLATAKTKTTLTAIKAITIELSTQQDISTKGTGSNKIVMTSADKGSNAIIFPTTPVLATNGNEIGTVTVALTPVVSRIEIPSITADETIDISSYKLEAIYVNNFNQAALPLGYTYGSSPYVVTTVDGFSNDAYKAFKMYDAPTSPTDGLLVPSASNIYAYQFFPVGNTMTANVPHIILKVKGISSSTTAGDYSEVISSTNSYYVNINAYTKHNPGDTFTSFEPGMVYSIGEIKLSEKNLMNNPFGAKNVTVGVTVNKWGSVILDPDFGY